jgi:low temperature requirement protein LtrA
MTAMRREEARVTALELFFDLVFVLAVTQCTALMANDATWQGLFRGLLVLAVLWWPWSGYAWLTSVVDPEEGAVRIAMFAAMAAFLVSALAVPNAFGDDALAFALAYGFVRLAHIWLFVIASSDAPGLRRSVTGLAASTGIGVGLLLAASAVDGWQQGALWVLALVTLVLVLALLCVLIAYEVTRFAETRERVRRELAHGHDDAAVAEAARMAE